MFAATNGLVTHFADEGPRSAPPIAMINSLGTDMRCWDRVAAALSREYRVVRYDKRGHGLSDLPPGPYSLDDFTGDLRGLLAHLGIDAAAVIGISIGGQIAMNFALRFPEAASLLVLCDTAPSVGSPAYWTERMEQVSAEGLERTAKSILPIWFSSSFADADPATHQGYLNMLQRMSTEGYVASCAALRDADLRERVGEIAAPTLVLVGDQDDATPPRQARELADRLPRSQFQMIASAGHLVSVEQPEAVAAAVQEFLQEAGHG